MTMSRILDAGTVLAGTELYGLPGLGLDVSDTGLTFHAWEGDLKSYWYKQNITFYFDNRGSEDIWDVILDIGEVLELRVASW